MLPAILNLVLPILFLVSIALLIYAIVLFINAKANNSKALKNKAIKIGILPLLYILISLAYFYYPSLKPEILFLKHSIFIYQKAIEL